MELSKQKQTEAKKLNVTVQYLVMADLMAVGYSENDAYSIAYQENEGLSVQQNNSIRGTIIESVKFKKLLENRRSRVKDGVAGMDDDYAMSEGQNNILLVYEGKNIKVTNAFHPGAMPFPIVSTFPGVGEVTAIEAVKTVEQNDAPAYNLAGQRTAAGYKGLVIKNGKKYFLR